VYEYKVQNVEHIMAKKQHFSSRKNTKWTAPIIKHTLFMTTQKI